MEPFRFLGRWAHASVMFGLAGLAAAVLWWRWVGYQGHDDAYYAWAAMDWVEHAPVLGQTHWALRYPLVLPTAALIQLFGFSVPVLAAVDLAAYAAFLVMGHAAARRWFGNTAAAALTAIGVLLPQFPVQATYANPDLLEMALVMGSFWLVMLAREPGAQAGRLLLGAGVLAGLGFLARETTLLLVPLYGLMFVVRPATRCTACGSRRRTTTWTARRRRRGRRARWTARACWRPGCCGRRSRRCSSARSTACCSGWRCRPTRRHGVRPGFTRRRAPCWTGRRRGLWCRSCSSR